MPSHESRSRSRPVPVLIPTYFLARFLPSRIAAVKSTKTVKGFQLTRSPLGGGGGAILPSCQIFFIDEKTAADINPKLIQLSALSNMDFIFTRTPTRMTRLSIVVCSRIEILAIKITETSGIVGIEMISNFFQYCDDTNVFVNDLNSAGNVISIVNGFGRA